MTGASARSLASERLMPGEPVDDFLVWERLHSGAQSLLYRVTGRETGFPLLMKVPRFQSGDPAENLLSYETEAMILPALSGPHVPRFVAAGDIRRTPYLVLEKVEGKSLESLLVRCPLPAAEVASIGAAVADAVHSLHRQDCVHCDLKPDNVLLRPSGEAVLIDFGLAWHTRFPDLLAEERRMAGSAPYISPEQVMGVRGDPRSDVFSLGAVVYELATGELPFGAPTTESGLRQRLWIDPDPPAALSPLPAALQEIILRCLEPEADKRYGSAAHVAFDLRHLDQVLLTQRAAKLRGAGFFEQTRRWWRARSLPIESPAQVKRTIDAAPVIMVAVDTGHPDDVRHPAIRRATRQLLTLSPEFRLICVSVIAAPMPGASGAQAQKTDHLEHLVRLRNWTEPLGLPPERLSQHVLEGADPAGALLDFARQNHVDLIVLGAPGPSEQALGWWRSVASGVTANAHCTVHVVRVPEKAKPAVDPMLLA